MEFIGPTLAALITVIGSIWVAYLRWGRNRGEVDEDPPDAARAADAVLDHRRELIDHLYAQIDDRDAEIERIEANHRAELERLDVDRRRAWQERNEAKLHAARLEERLKALQREGRHRE